MNLTQSIKTANGGRALEALISFFSLLLGLALLSGSIILIGTGASIGRGIGNGFHRYVLAPAIPFIIGGIGGMWKGGKWFRPVYIGVVASVWSLAVADSPLVPCPECYRILIWPTAIPIICSVALLFVPELKDAKKA